MKKVDRETYRTFVKDYPGALDRDVTAMCEPPMENYNDFEDGKKWPESMVAKHHLGTDDYWIAD